MRHRHQQEVDELRNRFKHREAGSASVPATSTTLPPATALAASPRRVSPAAATSPLPMDTEMDRTSSQASAGLGSREPPVATTEPSREALHTLSEMGFADERANRRALQEVRTMLKSKRFGHCLAVNAAVYE
jgi:hypothetical protein